MKSVGKNNYGFYALALICFVCAACTAPFLSPYYVQQQNRAANEGGGSQPPDWGGGDPIPPEQPLDPGKISMFSVLLPDGFIAEPKGDTTVHTQLAAKLNASDGFPFATFSTEKFSTWKFRSNFSASNVPEPKYDGEIEWKAAPESGNPERQQYGDGNESASAGGNSISSMTYYRYCGKNPFNLYTNEEYEVYGKDGKPTGTKEARMKRFIFYRFTGKGGGIVWLDNYIVAVDTYAKLVFAFAKPIQFKSVAGNQVPTKWAPVDAVSTGPGGKKYRFYEYDPAGYIAEDGSFYMSDTYKGNLANGNYDPAFTGKSPYLGYVGDAQKPAIQISNIALKNISIKDVGGDYPLGGSSNQAEFKYELKARYNNEEWYTFATNNGKKLSINVGTQKELAGNYLQEIEKPAEGSHSITISADIWEVDPLAGNSDDVIIKHEKPLFTVSYDNVTEAWNITGNSVQHYSDGDGEWKVTSVAMNEVQNGKKSTMKIGISAYIWDWVGVFKKAGWGDMELSFDVEWKNKK
ncbi:hypothetical protein [Treponema lecithinolyticum]|uniref:Lipoprotein n=1 Tax=Treponema lecithinolyticum ATCC 700332 TaxID=1321815 RepID=A0ABN0P051_TRELE|nr:hypothetical protein [Treponema lecithinolyticum]ERJ93685.1 hypothetical protein HMPREF9193_00779 [Treponema lecithinolyticum ATCC 700332]